MPKVTGFKVRIDAFVPIDKKDFGKQAAAFAMMDTIKKNKQLPADFWSTATVLDVDAKQGSAEIPDAGGGGPAVIIDPADPAITPLTTDGLPEGAMVLEQAEALDLSIIQTIRLADGTETMRRISAEQAQAEAPPPAETGGKGKRK